MDTNLLTRMTWPLIVAATVISVLLLLSVGVGPQTGKYRVITVLTGSMRPSFPEGSLIVQTPLPVRRVQVGDVISYRIPVEDRRIVTHRVVEIVEPGQFPVVRTQGDANNTADPWLARLEGDSTWQVRAGVPKAGYLLQWLREPAAQRLTQFVIPALLAVLWLRRIWRVQAAPEQGPDATAAPDGQPPQGFRTPLRPALTLAAIAVLVLLEHRARSGARPPRRSTSLRRIGA